jgi:hypothetical protein
LSKVLNQEDALGAPCLGCDFCSPQAPSRGAGMLRTGVFRRFGVTFTVAITRSSRRHALMLFPVVGGSARVERAGAGPNRAIVAIRP